MSGKDAFGYDAEINYCRTNLPNYCISISLKYIEIVWKKENVMGVGGGSNYGEKNRIHITFSSYSNKYAAYYTGLHKLCARLRPYTHTALQVYEKLGTVLTENTIQSYLSSAHTDHYML